MLGKSIEERFSLAGHTALVTGSSRGIGREIALTLAQAGAAVILHGSRPSEALERAAAEVRGSDARVESVAADLCRADGAGRLAGACRKAGLEPDILVLNASVQEYVKLEEYDNAEFQREFQANVGSAFELIRQFSPAMRRNRWGRIVTIGSINQMRPAARLSIYSATKAALLNLTRNCARELAPYGITVNNIAPGVILTDRNATALRDQNLKEAILARIPAGRFATPEEIAGTALLLCGNAAAYLTGAEIPVAGGMQL